MQAIPVEVNYDFICPWCWIGQRNLAAALAESGTGAAVSIRYMPFELNPSMPVEGMDRRDYRTRKFGSWARSQGMDAQVAAAGLAAGAPFNYDKVLRTPNTRLAHRLMQFAQSRHEPRKTAALYQAIYAAYFSEGRDIGALDTLAAIGAEQGFDADEVRAYLLSDSGNQKIDAAQREAGRLGIHSVPTIVIAGDAISGAQPPAVFINALRSAVQRSCSMRSLEKPRAVVVGGSLGGLLSATTLRAAGWDVDVFETSPNQLDSRGGGIVLQPDVLDALQFAGVALPDPPGVASGERIYLDREDTHVERLFMPQMQTSWSLLYRAMRNALPAASMHADETFVDFRMEGEQIVAQFESGRSERADLLIGADGIRSTLRRRLLPEVVPAYAGYVAWRGLVDEPDLPLRAADTLRDRFTFQQGEAHSALAYLIPGEGDSTVVGERRWNWVWYRKYSREALDALLVDRHGVARPFSLPPGTTRSADIAQLRADAKALLGPTFRALVDATEEPFMQPIVDLRAPKMVFGRVVLIGDAASVPRPHTAGSTAKAAANAHALALALSSTWQAGATIDSVLKRWENQQLQRGKLMTDLGVSLGDRLMGIAR